MEIQKELRILADDDKAQILQKFFKTEKGDYGEGDVFLGISVPVIRNVIGKYDLSFDEIKGLLNSKFHEERMAGLLILVEKYKENKKDVFDFYLDNLEGMNNWDLVDVSCHKIVGDFLIDKDKRILYELVNGNLWERRIAIVSCFAFIRQGDFEDILKISEMLLGDKDDLIHKAVGWMLREVGKRDEKVLEDFLIKNYDTLYRTTLRYAIEKFPEEKRKEYLRKNYAN